MSPKNRSLLILNRANLVDNSLLEFNALEPMYQRINIRKNYEIFAEKMLDESLNILDIPDK